MQSSIFNQDEQLQHFIQTFPNVKELQAVGSEKGRDLCSRAVEAVPKADPLLSIRFMPAILDHVLELLMTRSASSQTQSSAFAALTAFVHCVSCSFNDSTRCPLLMAYVCYRLDNSTAAGAASPPAAAHPPLYAVLSKAWLAGLTSRDAHTPAAAAASTSTAAPSAVQRSAQEPARSAVSSSSSSSSSSTSSSSAAAASDRLLVVYSWFYLECLAKSLAMERLERGCLSPQHRDGFLSDMRRLVSVFVSLVQRHRSVGLTVVRQLVLNLAAFFTDLLAVIEKEAVIALLEAFLLPLREVQHDPVLIELKFAFHSVLLDYAFYLDVAELHELDIAAIERQANDAIALQQQQHDVSAPAATDDDDGASPAPASAPSPVQPSQPERSESSSSSSGGGVKDYRELVRDGLLSTLRSAYRLCSLFLDDYVHHLSAREAVIRDAVIDSLRLFLTKQDHDARWRSAKPLIATMLFPLIPALCDEVDVVAGMEPRTRRSVLAPFLWTLHQLPSAVLHTYWSCEEAEEQLGLLSLLTLALSDFAYCGIRQREEEPAVDASLILAPETLDAIAAQSGQQGAASLSSASSSSIADYKTGLESYMSAVHKHRAFGGSRSKLASASSAAATAAAATPTPLPAAAASGSSSSAQSATALTGQAGGATASQPQAAAAGGSSSSSPSSSLPAASSLSPPAVAVASQAGLISQSQSSPASSSSSSSSSASSSSGSVPAVSGSLSSHSAVPAVAGSLRQLRANLASSRSMSGLGSRGGTMRSLTASMASASRGSSRELLMRLVRYEGALTRQVSRIVLSVCSRFIRAFAPALVNSQQAFLQVLRLLTRLLTSQQPNSFLLSVFPCCLAFVKRFGYAAHSSPERALEFSRLSNAVFRSCASSSAAVRRMAVACLYQFLMNEFAVEQSLQQLQTQLTMELSRLTDGLSQVQERCLQQSFAALTLLADRFGLQAEAELLQLHADPEQVFRPPLSVQAEEFRLRLSTLLHRLTTILGDSMEISRQSKLGADADSAVTESLLCQVADAFSHLPDVRIDWLLRLAKHHQQQLAYAEAGQCYLLVAQLAAQRKRDRERQRAEGAEGGSRPAAEEAAEAEAADRTIASYYEACVSQLDLAELYEQCSDVYAALLPFYHHWHDYARLSKAHLHLHAVFEKLLEANRSEARMLGSYYRVGFYGRRFGPRLDGLEFIYKLPKITRLSEVSTRLRSLYSAQLQCPVRVLPDSNPVDRSRLDPEDAVLQLTFVHPVFPADEAEAVGEAGQEAAATGWSNDVAPGLHAATFSPSCASLQLRPTLLSYSGRRPRSSFIEQRSCLSAFRFSTPFTSSGRMHGPVTEQHKRNTVLYVRLPFPAILTAQPVVRRTESILSPIEVAIEDVRLRTAAAHELLGSAHLHSKSLTQWLAGSVATQVHGGAREVCLAFLSTDREREPKQDELEQQQQQQGPAAAQTEAALRSSLRAALVSFLSACSRALEANSRLCLTDSEREFQASMDAMYEDMIASVQPYLGAAAGGAAAAPHHHHHHRHHHRLQQQPASPPPLPAAATSPVSSKDKKTLGVTFDA